MLQVNNLSKNFGKKQALHNVSFDIQNGEIFSLIGPNSSGKTTIVKSILGLLTLDAGTITVNGHSITKDPIEVKSTIGYIPDEPTIWSYMTGLEFLNFTKALYNVTDTTRTESLLATFNLSGTETSYFEDYSRGNKQKYSIIAALSHNPELLLIDEPIVGLDPTGAEIAKELFVNHAKNGNAVLLVTHTLPVAEEISHRIGVLKDGELIVAGAMDELRKKAELPTTATLEEVYKKLAN